MKFYYEDREIVEDEIEGHLQLKEALNTLTAYISNPVLTTH